MPPDPSPAEGGSSRCPVCDRQPLVLVGIRHRVMRAWTVELLDREHGCWRAAEPRPGEPLAAAIERLGPDLVVVDDADFPGCCRAALEALPADRVMVVGPEPEATYREHALARGAGGWVCRDDVGERLSAVMRTRLGCRHEPCPPAGGARPMATTAGSTGGRG